MMTALPIRSLGACLLLGLAGCVTPLPPLASELGRCENVFSPVRRGLYFATSRALDCSEKDPRPVITFSRGKTLTYGSIAGSWVPAFAAPEAWDAALSDDIKASRRVILYVHGFNNSFQAAAERAAGIAKAAGGTTPVIFYSWPSRGRVTAYGWDENNVAWTQRDLTNLLSTLAAKADQVTVVAHSMGTRLAIDAILQMQDRERALTSQINADSRRAPSLAAKIDRVILAAPDYDRDTLWDNARPELMKHSRKVTLYVSRLDRPLQTSWRLHGYARGGDSSCRYDLRRRNDRKHPRPDTYCYRSADPTGDWPDIVDLSWVSKKRLSLGHADFIESQGGFADLCHVLRGEPTTNRPPSLPGQNIWVLPQTPTPVEPHCTP